MKKLRKQIGDMWERYNKYGATQEQLAGAYRIPRTVVAQFVNERNRSEAWKEFKRTPYFKGY